MSNLGIAHGWAGLLYSTLCWCSAARVPLPRSFPERLEQLSACAEPVGRGVQWRWNFTGEHSMPGWCNGSAGYVFLWTLAHQAIGEMKYLDLAEGAAWNVWETPASISDLCCGMAGQAYALLNFYRHVGDTIWLRRARDAAHTAAVVTVKRGKTVSQALNLLPSQSLYKGELGLAVLDADLENPERARMPMFEREHPVI